MKRLSGERIEVLKGLQQIGREARTCEVAAVIGKSQSLTSYYLSKLHDLGYVQSLHWGKYSLNPLKSWEK